MQIPAAKRPEWIINLIIKASGLFEHPVCDPDLPVPDARRPAGAGNVPLQQPVRHALVSDRGLFFSIWPLLFGSLVVTLGALLIAIPFGVGTSVFISEIAPPWLNNLVKPLIEILAGLPSVVLGFLGIQVAAPFLRRLLDLPTGLTPSPGRCCWR